MVSGADGSPHVTRKIGFVVVFHPLIDSPSAGFHSGCWHRLLASSYHLFPPIEINGEGMRRMHVRREDDVADV